MDLFRHIISISKLIMKATMTQNAQRYPVGEYITQINTLHKVIEMVSIKAPSAFKTFSASIIILSKNGRSPLSCLSISPFYMGPISAFPSVAQWAAFPPLWVFIALTRFVILDLLASATLSIPRVQTVCPDSDRVTAGASAEPSRLSITTRSTTIHYGQSPKDHAGQVLELPMYHAALANGVSLLRNKTILNRFSSIALWALYFNIVARCWWQVRDFNSKGLPHAFKRIPSRLIPCLTEWSPVRFNHFANDNRIHRFNYSTNGAILQVGDRIGQYEKRIAQLERGLLELQ